MRLADLCARTEQCSADLRGKMLRAGLGRDAIERILEKLKERKFLDEARFARAYARDKARFSGWGIMKIRQGLAAKRIPSDLIDEGIAAIDRHGYIEALKRSALSKARQLDMSTPDGAQKLFRHLATRGYETSLISKIVNYLRQQSR